jgi:hypothetical protein
MQLAALPGRGTTAPLVLAEAEWVPHSTRLSVRPRRREGTSAHLQSFKQRGGLISDPNRLAASPGVDMRATQTVWQHAGSYDSHAQLAAIHTYLTKHLAPVAVSLVRTDSADSHPLAAVRKSHLLASGEKRRCRCQRIASYHSDPPSSKGKALCSLSPRWSVRAYGQQTARYTAA